ncbi:MAG TPA: PadR family transcriptional regulator [Verrucomicrobia bacterium]|nr:PadR family transcriptional regulator [Verrucomicrobiota bacterium]
MIDGWITQLRKGLLEYCVLLVLRRGESYGYEIVQALKRIEDLSVSESTVYPILGRLREEGFLKSRDVPSDAGPPRRYFSLTPRGKVRLAEMNAYWPMLTNALEQLKSDKEKESGS